MLRLRQCGYGSCQLSVRFSQDPRYGSLLWDLSAPDLKVFWSICELKTPIPLLSISIFSLSLCQNDFSQSFSTIVAQTMVKSRDENLSIELYTLAYNQDEPHCVEMTYFFLTLQCFLHFGDLSILDKPMLEIFQRQKFQSN